MAKRRDDELANRQHVKSNRNATFIRVKRDSPMPHVGWEHHQRSYLWLNNPCRRQVKFQFPERLSKLNTALQFFCSARQFRERHIQDRAQPSSRMDMVSVEALPGKTHRPCARKLYLPRRDIGSWSSPEWVVRYLWKPTNNLCNNCSQLLLQFHQNVVGIPE